MLIGIVGKPNVGKSTFFKAATLAEAEIANYPFATIKPNTAVGYVKVECACKFFNVRCNPREGFCIESNRFVPVQLIDVAGLVPGAHEGKGMGNQFLDDLRQANALIHVIDVSGSTDEKGNLVKAGSNNPENDINFLEHELNMWYLQILKKGWEKFSRKVQQESQDIKKALAKQLSALNVTEEIVEAAIKKTGISPEKPAEWNESQLKALASELRKKTKNMIIACNKADTEEGYKNFTRLKEKFKSHTLIPCSAEAELALKEAAKKGIIKYIPGNPEFEILKKESLSDAQLAALGFIKENVLKRYGSTGIQDALNKAVFGLLGYIAVFPGGLNKLEDKDGNVLPDCFLMPKNTTAIDFAYRLHTDIGDNFIKAIDVKTKMAIGKEHALKNGDVIEIVVRK